MRKHELSTAVMKKFIILTLLFAGFLTVNQPILSGEETVLAPEKVHRISGPVIARLLGQYHYNQQNINDKISKETLNLYLRDLDRNRMYFLASDIAEFDKYRDRLDDEVLSGNFEAPYLIFNTLRTRLGQRLDFVNQQLVQGFDFTKEESFQLDRTEAPWAKTRAELDKLWRKKLKNEALNLKLNGTKEEEIQSTLQKRYENLQRRIEQYNSEDVFQLFMNGLAGTFDPHTSYFSPITSENFGIEMSLSFEGIGAQLTSEDEFTKVVRILPGGPAEKSEELWADDKIIGVAQGADGEMEDVVGWRLDDVVQKIRGPKGSIVRLEIMPADTPPGSPSKEVVLKRDKIVLEERAAKSDTVQFMFEGEPYKLGVIDIPSFYSDLDAQRRGIKNYKSTTRDVRRLISELQGADVDGIIIDLRRNGGGSLQEAIDLTGLFIEEGPIVQVRNSRGKRGVEKDHDPSIIYNGPLAVLIDRFSASASEIFSAAIQDYGRGIVIGSQSYGKGTVQRLLGLDRFINSNDQFGQLKVTTAKFYRITGGTTQNLGVIPDITFPSLYNEMEIYGENNKLHALPWDEISPANFQPDDRVSRYIATLRNSSSARRVDNREFRYILEDIKRYQEDEASDNTISLNEKERMAKRDRMEAQKLARVNARRAEAGKEPIPPGEKVPRDEPVPDAWLTEAQDIVAEYIMLSGAKSPTLSKTQSGDKKDGEKKSDLVDVKRKQDNN